MGLIVRKFFFFSFFPPFYCNWSFRVWLNLKKKSNIGFQTFSLRASHVFLSVLFSGDSIISITINRLNALAFMMITDRLDQEYFLDFGTNRNDRRTIEQLCALFFLTNKYKEDNSFIQRFEVLVRHLDRTGCVLETADQRKLLRCVNISPKNI